MARCINPAGMVVYSNAATQTLQPGQSLVLTRLSGCNCNSNNCCAVNPTSGANVKGTGTFSVAFSGNIANTADNNAVELTIEVNGAPIPTTTMQASPATANVFEHVSTVTGFSSSGCALGSKVTVQNTGTNPIVVAANASLVIWRS